MKKLLRELADLFKDYPLYIALGTGFALFIFLPYEVWDRVAARYGLVWGMLAAFLSSLPGYFLFREWMSRRD
jgi:hypothetical protein